jgi:hypothetical protein
MDQTQGTPADGRADDFRSRGAPLRSSAEVSHHQRKKLFAMALAHFPFLQTRDAAARSLVMGWVLSKRAEL